jgi:DNA replication factor GINS
MTDDPSGLTAEEHDLYEAIVSLIEENKSLVLESFAGERGTDSAAELGPDQRDDSPESERGEERSSASRDPAPPAPPDETESREGGPLTEDGADRQGNESVATESAEGDEDGDQSVERMKVRITEDVGEILGVDQRAYTLRADDVVDLPEANATPLIDREAAEPLE